jgi:isopenicillin-N epimerase
MQWELCPRTTYLNHGSFGPPLVAVRSAQREWQDRANRQPMDFFVRQLEPAWRSARAVLAEFVGCYEGDLVFCENATAAMNHIASFFPLAGGDEVLLTDHEYGVTKRIWQRRCAAAGAEVREVRLSLPVGRREQLVAEIEQAITPRTRLIVVSHITSPTAITLPVADIVATARSRRIAICIDGPHAPVQVPLHIDSLHADFYVASCHKWLSAPFGTGFTYVAPQWQALAAQPLAISWGRLPPAPLATWSDHHLWCGTRDYSGYLVIPTAIHAMQAYGLAQLRERNHALARYARLRLMETLQTDALVPDDAEWYSMMAAVWLPPGDHTDLQCRLWERHRIEVPVIAFAGRQLIRVSCHLYNDESAIARLLAALRSEIG